MRAAGCLVILAALVGGIAAEATTQAPAYREEEVLVENGDIRLSGTLTLPAGEGPFPAVVLVSGSGPQNRDSELFGFAPFRVMAEHFARVGIAVLRCDDRGVGRSSGSVRDSTTEDFADDALAAIKLLSARRDIRPSSIGILGHSEGAHAAAIAAGRSDLVRFIVWLGGSAISGHEVLRGQAVDMATAGGADEAAVARIEQEHAGLLEAVRANAPAEQLAERTRRLARAQIEAMPQAQRSAIGDIDAAIESGIAANVKALQSRGLRFIIDFDPSAVLARVACPVLAVFGGRDLQVPPSTNRPRLESALAAGRRPSATVKVYPDANHLFIKAVTGHPAEYQTLEKRFVDGLLDEISSWILERR